VKATISHSPGEQAVLLGISHRRHERGRDDDGERGGHGVLLSRCPSSSTKAGTMTTPPATATKGGDGPGEHSNAKRGDDFRGGHAATR